MSIRLEKLAIIGLVLLMSVQAMSQIVLNGPAIDPNDPGTCSILRIESTVDFQRGSTCNPALGITICKDDPNCTNVVFQTTDEFFNYSFDEAGFYYIFCDVVPATGATEVFAPILCYEVPPLVPTLGEWAAIILFLTLLIFGVVAVSNRYQKRYFTAKVRK